MDEHGHHENLAGLAQLNQTYETIRRWTDAAHQFESEAEDARRLARELGDELAKLRGLFDPVRTLHTRATWEGNAADQSRRRLDQHEDQFTIGRWQIDRLIDQLETKALTAARAAEASRDSIDSAQRTAWNLEAELGQRDTIFR